MVIAGMPHAASGKNAKPGDAVLDRFTTRGLAGAVGLSKPSRRSRVTSAEQTPAAIVCGAPRITSFAALVAATDAPWIAEVSPANETVRVIASASVPEKKKLASEVSSANGSAEVAPAGVQAASG